jgi:hypothetical protein
LILHGSVGALGEHASPAASLLFGIQANVLVDELEQDAYPPPSKGALGMASRSTVLP